MILSDDTNGAGGANLTPLICLLLHHHQLTSLILLHQHQLTSTRVCPIWPISLACGSGPFLWSKHKTKIAQIELNYVQIQILLLCNLKGTTGCLKAICLLWEPPICKISWVHVSLYLLFASLCQLDGRMPSAQPSFDSSPNRPVRTVYPIPSHPVRFALLFSPTCSSSPKRKIILQVKMPSVFDRHEKEYSTVSKWWWWWIIAMDLQNKKKQILNYLRGQARVPPPIPKSTCNPPLKI